MKNTLKHKLQYFIFSHPEDEHIIDSLMEAMKFDINNRVKRKTILKYLNELIRDGHLYRNDSNIYLVDALPEQFKNEPWASAHYHK